MASLKKIRFNKVISFVIVFAVILSVFGLITLNSASESFSNSADAEVWYGGSYTFEDSSATGGTADDPYIISSPENLAYLANMVNSGTTYTNRFFKLTVDLDFNNIPWTPIGNETYAFQGYFDGDSHKITNLNIQNSEFLYYGLFGNIGSGATVLNIILSSGSIIGENNNTYAGSLAGNVDGAIIKYIKNEGVSVNGKNGYAIGGVIGSANASNIEGVYNYAAVESIGSMTGGVLGVLDSSNLRYSINYGSVLGISNLGGVIGKTSESEIESISNNGKIETRGNSDIYTDIGGLIGKAVNIDSIKLSGNAGSITGGNNIGGLIGSFENTAVSACEIKFSYNIGEVSSTYGSAAGLIANFTGSDLSVYKCYNLGEITVPSGQISDALVIGLDSIPSVQFEKSYYLNTLTTDANNVTPLAVDAINYINDYLNESGEEYFIETNSNNKFGEVRLIWELCGGGDGSYADPYYVIDEDFFSYSGNRFTNLYGQCFKQVFDIEFSKESNMSFKTLSNFLLFDGNNRKIYNYNSGYTEINNSMFGTKKYSVIENVNIVSGSFLSSKRYSASYKDGVLGDANYGIVRNCYVNVDFEFSNESSSQGSPERGFLFVANYGIIENCVVDGSVNLGVAAKQFYGFGGLVSDNRAVIRNCISYVDFINVDVKEALIKLGGFFIYGGIDYFDKISESDKDDYIVDYFEFSNCLFLGSFEIVNSLKSTDFHPLGIFPDGSVDLNLFYNNPNSKIENCFYMTDNLSEECLDLIERTENNFPVYEEIYSSLKGISSIEMVTKQEETKPKALENLSESMWEFKPYSNHRYYFPVLKNIDYTPKYIVLYRAEFNDISNENPQIIQYVKSGEKFTRPEESIGKTGYYIYDWFYEIEFENKFDFDVVTYDDVVLYGNWQLIPPVVSLVSNAENNTVESGQKLILTVLVSHPLNGEYIYDWIRVDGSEEVPVNNPYPSLTLSSPLDTGEYYCNVSFRFKPEIYDDSHATTEKVAITVTRIIPDVDAPIIDKDYTTSDTLEDVILPDGWTWEKSDTALSKGENYYNAIYTPSDLINYQPVVKQVRVYAFSQTALIVLWSLLPILICALILLLLYLIWLFWLRTYTVDFETFGGEKIETLRFRYGEAVTVPTPTKYNCEFLGWMSDFSLNTPFKGGGMPRRNITLFAKWRTVPKCLYISRNADALPAGNSQLLAIAPPNTETTIIKDPDGNIIRKVKYIDGDTNTDEKRDVKGDEKTKAEKTDNTLHYLALSNSEAAAANDKTKDKNNGEK